MDLGLNDKVAIITGGSDGIGKAAAWRMALEGAAVTICARRKEVLDDAAEDIRSRTEGRVLAIQADVTVPQDIERVVNATVDQFGRLDILVNNAGQSAAGPFESVTDEDWQADFDLKLWASIRFARASIPHMRQVGGGRIINVTNLGAKAPGPSSVPTSVSRAAGVAVTKALSKDLAKDNILVNTVCIGLIKSGQNRRRYDAAIAQDPNLTLDEYYEDMAQRRSIPIGRVGESEEAGDVIAFLASDRASFLTGIAVNIDGGASPVV
jgi:NAD(P)-dependent dehydrogenase (short-subunit alcohol dehydrogenase family)